MSNQKGFAALIVLIPVILFASVLAVGFFYFTNNLITPTQDGSKSSPSITPAASHNVSAQVTEDPSHMPSISSPEVIPNGWKRESLSSCKISFIYPEDFLIDIYEEKTACIASLGQTKPKPIQMHILANGTSKIDLDSLKKSEAKSLSVDGITGFIQPAGTIDNITADVFYLQKQNVLYIGQISHEVGDNEGADLAMKIVSSLKFTGSQEEYSGEVVVNFNNHITESIYSKTNAKVLKKIIEDYKADNGKLPERLTDLNTGSYINIWNSTRKGTDDFAKYYYDKSGDKFTVKVYLPNNKEYIIEGGVN